MNVITLNNFHKICRTCSRDEDELISLHENHYLTEMLRLCAQIDFEINDNLPQQICLSCIDELNKTYTFTIKCKMVDAALRNFLQENKLKNDEKEEPAETPIVAENEEFKVTIKTENCEDNSNDDGCRENITCSQCNEIFTSLSDLINHQKLERHFSPDAPTDNPPKKKRKGKPRKNENTSPILEPSPAGGVGVKKDRTFKCQTCNKVINNLSNFRRHEQIHSGEKKFSCHICNKNFRHSGTLITHQRSHSGERPCVCDVCGKTFVDLSTLGRHKKIHSGEKKFQCDICSKRFTQSGDLNVHRRLHFEKPFSCEICQKRFNRKSHLLKHSKVHLKHLNNAKVEAAATAKHEDEDEPAVGKIEDESVETIVKESVEKIVNESMEKIVNESVENIVNECVEKIEENVDDAVTVTVSADANLL